MATSKVSEPSSLSAPMKLSDLRNSTGMRGFTLPAVLIVACALLLLAVGMLAVVGVERKTARSFVDRQRAEMAARAALEEVKGKLILETANDDYFIIHGEAKKAEEDSAKEPAPYLYIARGSVTDPTGSADHSTASYRHIPLFSHAGALDGELPLKGPEGDALDDLLGDDLTELKTLPWQQPSKVAWMPMYDNEGQLIARYAYWVEDLQGKINAKLIADRPDGSPTPREQSSDGASTITAINRHPAPGTNAKPLGDGQPALNSIAFHILDPASGDEPKGNLTQKLFDGKAALLSPGAILGATGYAVSPGRDPATGLLLDPIAAALEKSVSPVIEKYEEQPLIPYADGISKASAGTPKLNLNKLLSDNRSSAVDEFAEHIGKALPNFDKRKGGFPHDYLKTLAANAFDYADEDHDATIGNGYRGIDSYPQLSELLLLVQYKGYSDAKQATQWRFRLFGELWNMSNKPFNGNIAVSYEVDLTPEGIGAGVRGLPFSHPSILDDELKTEYPDQPGRGKLGLFKRPEGGYVTLDRNVTINPDGYVTVEFADVEYTIPSLPPFSSSEKFSLDEGEGASGITLYVNNIPAQRIDSIIRMKNGATFEVRKVGWSAKAAIPGHSYGVYEGTVYANNMGDPRISHYISPQNSLADPVMAKLAENKYPGNASFGRRNIRRSTIYDYDTQEKRIHYGRVMPSEWPDGGHDSAVGNFLPKGVNVYDLDILPTDLNAFPLLPAVNQKAGNAPQRISNVGKFSSVTELGHIFDPVMWKHAYADEPGKSGTADTLMLTRSNNAMIPPSRNQWPNINSKSSVSGNYGGGNTLRIGRPEHPLFDVPGMRAAYLLDLFHASRSTSQNSPEKEGGLVEICGQVNINTANKEVLRALAVGTLLQDSELRVVTSWNHLTGVTGTYAPRTTAHTMGTPTRFAAADRIAEAIIKSRPIGSMAELTTVKDDEDKAVFGNREIYENSSNIQWSDAAAEEVFARVHDAATLRSRNFRVWVIGQTVVDQGGFIEVLGETRKYFTIFAEPGERNADNSLNVSNFKSKVTYESDY